TRTRHITKADNAQLPRAQYLETVGTLQQGLGVIREPAAMLDEAAKPTDAERLDRKPDFQGPEAPGQGNAVVGEVDFFLSRRDVLHVIGAQHEGVGESLALAHQHAARFKRLGKPLVRVERDRIGALDAAQLASPFPGQYRRPTVGA